jgi:DNA-binding transcriptional LysR family regulator
MKRCAVLVLERLDGARRDLEALDRLEHGRLRVGAFPTAVAALIPRSMAAFRAEHRNVSLSLVEGTTPRQLNRVRARDVDLAVVSAFPDQELDADRIELSHLLDDAMLVAFARSHRLGRRQRVRLAELVDESWIAADTSGDDHLLGPGSVRLATRPRVDFVANGWTEKLGLVAAGLGITLVPSLAAQAARPDVALARLDAQDGPPRKVYAATLERVARAPATDAFIQVLRATARRIRVGDAS